MRITNNIISGSTGADIHLSSVQCVANIIESNDLMDVTKITNSGTNTTIKNNLNYPYAGDTRWNADHLEAWNSTHWVVIGP